MWCYCVKAFLTVTHWLFRWKPHWESVPLWHDQPKWTMAETAPQRPHRSVWVPDPGHLRWTLLRLWLQQVLPATWRVLWTLHLWPEWQQDLPGRMDGSWLQYGWASRLCFCYFFFFFCIYLKKNFFLWCKAEFSVAITPVFSVTCHFRMHSNILIWKWSEMFCKNCQLKCFQTVAILRGCWVRVIVWNKPWTESAAPEAWRQDSN